MNIAIVTLFPEMFSALTEYGISGRAVSKGLVQIKCINPRDFAGDRHQTVDNRPYGGGPGMVMMVEPLQLAVHEAKRWMAEQNAADAPSKVIYLSPQGRRLEQQHVAQLRQAPNLILIAGRYEGVDERFIEQEVDEEWSIGDYVLSGGELPAMVLMDALIRLHPEALGDVESAQQDSFTQGLLDCPHYTRPESYDGRDVPNVLLSGDHRRIERWRLQQALGRTWERRPDLLKSLELDSVQEALLQEYRNARSLKD